MTKFQIYQDRKGEYRWRLRASNGEIIADSNEGYSRKDSCKHGIDLIKQQAAGAEVEDQTQGPGREHEQTAPTGEHQERRAAEEPSSSSPGREDEGLIDKAKRKLQE